MSDDSSKDNVKGTKIENSIPASVTCHPSITERLDTVFDLLSNARCRYLLYYLSSLDDNVAELDAAANAVYACEAAETDANDLPPQKNIKMELHHRHLPRLAAAGRSDYDHRQGTIRFTLSPTLEELVEHARHKELD